MIRLVVFITLRLFSVMAVVYMKFGAQASYTYISTISLESISQDSESGSSQEHDPGKFKFIPVL